MFIADSDLNHKVLFSEMLAAKNIGDKVNILEMLREGLTRKIKKKVLPESQIFLDILGKNLVVFNKFSRFISEKINSFYQNMFQLMCEKKNPLKFHTPPKSKNNFYS